jgi:hypothetical protein
VEDIRQFHLRDRAGAAVCGTDVGMTPEALFAAHPSEVTCSDCLRLALCQSLMFSPVPADRRQYQHA